MGYSVGQVSSPAGVTARTLHHDDKAGLLSPSGHSHAGYRLYDDAALARLQQILFYRELGSPLDEIAAILDAPQANALEHLHARQRQLRQEIVRLRRLAEATERAIEVQRTGVALTPEERFELFGEITFDLNCATDAQLKLGHSGAHQEAMRGGHWPFARSALSRPMPAVISTWAVEWATRCRWRPPVRRGR